VKYDVRFKPRAVKDIKALAVAVRRRVLAGIDRMSDDLKGDVKRLTNYSPEYRLRIGEYRILFEVEMGTVIVYRVLHRREAFR
jgi:mRNA interferase RelE/StbE